MLVGGENRDGGLHGTLSDLSKLEMGRSWFAPMRACKGEWQVSGEI